MEIKIHKLSLCTKIDMEKCISETDAKNKGHITPRNKRIPNGYRQKILSFGRMVIFFSSAWMSPR